ncbi:Aste57867_9902 [Aphanomyces stellatus]|uniref:Aste57867_9902 protein n=1 Tax=Aphanomyces stellatus TaxID=120398 RepID=A0A485KP13_9STRA|nr:hypothetical protein As57867_009863 [Aphanomyces stellatus]VFT86781.1 Aste57867_9902 [Aphanomyces stellatus]
MDSETFDALNNVLPRGNITDDPHKVLTEGVEYWADTYQMTLYMEIHTNKTTCDSYGGQVKELWRDRKPLVENAYRTGGTRTEIKSPFTVCVTTASTVSTGLVSAIGHAIHEAPVAVGLAAGCSGGVAIVLVAQVMVSLMRRVSAKPMESKRTTKSDDVKTDKV